MVHDIRQRIQAFLHRKCVFVVECAKELGRLTRREQVRRARQTDRERVQTRPCHERARVVVQFSHLVLRLGLRRACRMMRCVKRGLLCLGLLGRLARGNGGDERRVQTTT